MRKLILGVALLLVVAACGGGDGDGGGNDTTTTTTAGSSAAGATTTTSGDNGGGDGPGSNTDFCGFDDEFEDTLTGAFTLSPQSIEDAMQSVLQTANQAADVAPSELRDEVNLLLGGFTGMVDAMADIDYDLINNLAAFENDPRVMNLESPEFLAAGQAIDDYCGTGDDGPTSPTIPGTDVTVPGNTDGTLPPGVVSGDLPDDFLSEWVPAGNLSVQTIDVGVGFQVTFMTDASWADVVAGYTPELGEPTTSVVAPGASNAGWFLADGTIIVAQETGDVVSVTVAGAN